MKKSTLEKLIDELTQSTYSTTYKYLNHRTVAENSFYINFEIIINGYKSTLIVVLDLFPTDCKLFMLETLDFNLWNHLEAICGDLMTIQTKLNAQYQP